jgi:hypothetical protein
VNENVSKAVASNDQLGPLPEADGTAETNKEWHPEGGYTYDEIPAWSEPLVRAYAAAARVAERERCAAAVRAVPSHRWVDGSDQCGRPCPAKVVATKDDYVAAILGA